MADKQSVPIWHSPVWITAMVAVVSAFLTIPEIVGNYYTKQLANKESNQKQEFEIVHNTLSQQGPERVFILRYLAKTLDDEDAKTWAEGEVKRLDEISSLENELKQVKIALQEKIEQSNLIAASDPEIIEATRSQIAKLQSEFNSSSAQLNESRKKAGIQENNDIGNKYEILIAIGPHISKIFVVETLSMSTNLRTEMSCTTKFKLCRATLNLEDPENIYLFAVNTHEKKIDKTQFNVQLRNTKAYDDTLFGVCELVRPIDDISGFFACELESL